MMFFVRPKDVRLITYQLVVSKSHEITRKRGIRHGVREKENCLCYIVEDDCNHNKKKYSSGNKIYKKII